MEKKIVFFLLIFCIGALGAAGCTGPASSPPGNPGLSSGYLATGAPTVSSENNLSLGQTAASSVYQATVYSAQKTGAYRISGSRFSETGSTTAPPGTMFVIIDAEVRNTGSGPVYSSPDDFSLNDSVGNRYQAQAYYAVDGITPQELYPGQFKDGKVLFQVPLAATGLKLYYDFGDASGTHVASWIIPGSGPGPDA